MLSLSWCLFSYWWWQTYCGIVVLIAPASRKILRTEMGISAVMRIMVGYQIQKKGSEQHLSNCPFVVASAEAEVEETESTHGVEDVVLRGAVAAID